MFVFSLLIVDFTWIFDGLSLRIDVGFVPSSMQGKS